MYSGGYRPNVRENVQYPMQGGRDQRSSPWQDRDKFSSQKKDEDRKDRMQIPRGNERVMEPVEMKRGSPRKSRSAERRDRSPLADRYRRYSPSPRSPRRSWALDKRRSPAAHEAPPPPSWPGQSTPREDPYLRQNRPNFPDKVHKEEKIKHAPVWDSSFARDKREESPRDRRDPFENPQIRVRRDLEQVSHRESPPRRFKAEEERYPTREPKYRDESPVDRRENFPRTDPERRKYPDREEFLARSEQQYNTEYTKKMIPRRPEDRTEVYLKNPENFDKDFDDIYKRAVEFAKKTQELRKHDRKREDYVDERHRELERGEDRHKLREDDRRREHFEDPRQEYPYEGRGRLERPPSRHSDDYKRHDRGPQWEDVPRTMNPVTKSKRDKAADEIIATIVQKHINDIPTPELKSRVEGELREIIFELFHNMFGDSDVSFIQYVIKFNAKYDARDKEKMFEDAMGKFAGQFRGTKRSAAGEVYQIVS